MDLTELRGKYIAAVSGAAGEAALEEVRLAALGKKGEISALMSTLGKMDPEDRKSAGAAERVEGRERRGLAGPQDGAGRCGAG
jgi:phenylalanyl-tRNA synthetase alpha chain